MRWRWQKQIGIGRGYIMFTVGQGFGLGLIYHTCNMSIWLGPLVIDFTVPTPLWWAMVRQDRAKDA